MNTYRVQKTGLRYVPGGTCAVILSLLFCFCLWPMGSRAEQTVIATGLNGPIKIDLTKRGNLLVSERGSGINDGRLSLVDRLGNVQSLVGGLPSALEVTAQPSGPTAVLVHGCCVVLLAIGEGDTLRFPPAGSGDPPGTQLPNPVGASSPLFSSVLRLRFSFPVDELMGGFELTPQDHVTLAEGFTVKLENNTGETVWIRLLEDLKDFWPDPLTNVRGSNPFGMTRGKGQNNLLIVDGGQNSLVQISLSEPPKTLLHFPQVPNPQGVLPPFTDAVPTSVRHFKGNQFFVTTFGGVPFAEGTASVRLVDIKARTESELIPGLTAVSDVLTLGSKLYVLQLFSGDLLRFADPSQQPVSVASGLLGPTAMVYSSRDRAIYITELFGGQVTRVDP